jgi:phosphatidylserine decarboxylase
VKEGQTVKGGEEFGFIKFGSRIDLYLPLSAKIKVSLNQKVKGQLTEIAEL